jgi:dihydrofolate reductase
MGSVIVNEFLTLDGVMQAPGDPEEDRSGGFEHGGWQMPYFDEAMGSAIAEGMATSGGFLLGRRTYEILSTFWPNQPADALRRRDEQAPQVRCRHDPGRAAGVAELHLLKGDVAGAVAGLKRQLGRDLQVIGSGELVQTLIRHGLVDEYRLMVHPLVLGSGRRLFREGTVRTALQLVDTRTTGTGVVALTYRPRGGGGRPPGHVETGAAASTP